MYRNNDSWTYLNFSSEHFWILSGDCISSDNIVRKNNSSGITIRPASGSYGRKFMRITQMSYKSGYYNPVVASAQRMNK